MTKDHRTILKKNQTMQIKNMTLHFKRTFSHRCYSWMYSLLFSSEWQNNTWGTGRKKQKETGSEKQSYHSRRPTVGVNYYPTQLLDLLLKMPFKNDPFMCFILIKILLQKTDFTSENLNERIYYNMSELLRQLNKNV